MARTAVVTLGVVFLCFGAVSPVASAADAREAHERAVAEIEAHGGRVDVRRTEGGREVVRVTTDGAWSGGEDALAYLKDIRGLEQLRLGKDISDDGLVHLVGLSDLKALDLHSRSVTDAGLATLARLTGIERLNLTYTRITDAGLRHLETLVNLKWLGLLHTDVTPEGVAWLQERLPDTRIEGSFHPGSGD